MVNYAKEQPGWHPKPSYTWRTPHFKFNLLFLVTSPWGLHSPTRGQARLETRIYTLRLLLFVSSMLFDRMHLDQMLVNPRHILTSQKISDNFCTREEMNYLGRNAVFYAPFGCMIEILYLPICISYQARSQNCEK